MRPEIAVSCAPCSNNQQQHSRAARHRPRCRQNAVCPHTHPPNNANFPMMYTVHFLWYTVTVRHTGENVELVRAGAVDKYVPDSSAWSFVVAADQRLCDSGCPTRAQTGSDRRRASEDRRTMFLDHLVPHCTHNPRGVGTRSTHSRTEYHHKCNCQASTARQR